MGQIRTIRQRIARAETEYIERENPERIWLGRTTMFFTDAPRRAVYGATRPETFAHTIENLPIPRDRVFIDLGSGLGGITFVAGLYFRRAMGIELSPSLYDATLEIKPELDFNKRVSFWNNDFLDVDLGKFGVIHVYEPFCQNLAGELERIFQRVQPGTIVIPHMEASMLVRVLPPKKYKQVLPADPAEGDYIFLAFQRA